MLDPEGIWEGVTEVSPRPSRYVWWRDFGIWAVLLTVPVTVLVVWLLW